MLFRCSMNVSSRTRLRVGFRCFEGHFRTRWCLRCVFCSVMHHCVVRRSGSVPTEITEPARRLDRPGTYSSKHAKQRLPGKPIDLRQFPDHSLPGAFFLGAKNHIENRATSETVWAQFIFRCGKSELITQDAFCNNFIVHVFRHRLKVFFIYLCRIPHKKNTRRSRHI